MACKRQRHVAPAPVISASAPFLRARPLSLRRLAVVEEKSRVAFQRAQHRAVGKNPGRAHKIARPIAAAFRCARVEQPQVIAGLGIELIAIRRVKISNVIGRIGEWLMRDTPRHVFNGLFRRTDEFDFGRVKKRHWKEAIERFIGTNCQRC